MPARFSALSMATRSSSSSSSFNNTPIALQSWLGQDESRQHVVVRVNLLPFQLQDIDSLTLYYWSNI
jgi:hypothetical protein